MGLLRSERRKDIYRDNIPSVFVPLVPTCPGLGETEDEEVSTFARTDGEVADEVVDLEVGGQILSVV